jgi:hypothetical protein
MHTHTHTHTHTRARTHTHTVCTRHRFYSILCVIASPQSRHPPPCAYLPADVVRYKDFGDDEVVIPAPRSSKWEYRELVGSAEGWTERKDPQNGKWFFSHPETGQATEYNAKKPDCPSKGFAFVHKKTGEMLWVRDTGGAMRWGIYAQNRLPADCTRPRTHFEVFDFLGEARRGSLIPPFKAFVQNVAAYGGFDTPEDVLGGLRTAMELRWPQAAGARVIFHIGDAPPHGTPLYHDNK